MRLPPPPDFAAIEAVSHTSANRRTMILALIGNLVFAWANNESMLIYIIMLLMQTDQTSATIVFGTLNTTRARVDLIQRLAKAKITDRGIAKELDGLIKRFNDATKIRNEFNHCTFAINERGEITHTYTLRIQETKDRLQLGTLRKMDDRRIKELVDTFAKMKQLNRDLWSFLPRLESHMSRSTVGTAAKNSINRNGSKDL
jgi:hypothetical protein